MTEQTDKVRCKKRVYAGTYTGHPCSKKVWKDGYCKVHHPDSVKTRQEKSQKRYDEKLEKDPLRLALAKVNELQAELEAEREKVRKLRKDIQGIHCAVKHNASTQGQWVKDLCEKSLKETEEKCQTYPQQNLNPK